jgi:hypothetical protein
VLLVVGVGVYILYVEVFVFLSELLSLLPLDFGVNCCRPGLSISSPSLMESTGRW